MAGKGKKIGITVLVLIAGAIVAGYYQWNKPHKDIAAVTAIKTGASQLYDIFITDTAAARKNYQQQVVEVKGMVNSISKNQQNQPVITLKTGTEGAFINCTMEGTAGLPKEGTEISIKGICEGIGQADADLGIMGDVYLRRCYLAE